MQRAGIRIEAPTGPVKGNRWRIARTFGWLLAFVLGLGTASQVSAKQRACNSDMECPDNEICVEKFCAIPSPDLAPVGENVPQQTKCSSDTDCPGVEICDKGLCAKPVLREVMREDAHSRGRNIVLPPHEPGSCVTDLQCSDRNLCERGRCVTLGDLAPAPSDVSGCT